MITVSSIAIIRAIYVKCFYFIVRLEGIDALEVSLPSGGVDVEKASAILFV